MQAMNSSETLDYRFGVVIPYFQRSRGVLAQSLRSVAAQDVAARVLVVVVDDGSPVPAEEEVAEVEFPANFAVRIIHQANAGPGAARNHGIDALADVEFLAFLDSDDHWEAFHLASALHAFEQGFDYYTAETLDVDSGYRRHADHFREGLPLQPTRSAPWAHELKAPLINFSVRGPIAGSSTFVARRTLIGETRYRTDLKTSGEDGLFATCLAAKQPRVMVSSRVDVKIGRGVNIFSAGDWGSAACSRRAMYFLRSRLLMRPLVMPFPEAMSFLQGAISKARLEVWRSIIANVRRGGVPWSDLARLVAADPKLLLALPALLMAYLRPR